MTKITSPIKPHELPKHMLRGLTDIARRVALACAIEGRGADILERVYMAGLYHGAELSQQLAEYDDDGRDRY